MPFLAVLARWNSDNPRLKVNVLPSKPILLSSAHPSIQGKVKFGLTVRVDFSNPYSEGGFFLCRAVLDPHLKSAELRLVQVEKEREQLEEAFNKTFRAIANHDEFRRRLVSEQACITARRSVLLEERARLLKSLGRIH